MHMRTINAISVNMVEKKSGRRYHDILANSGEEMEDGSISHLDKMYVMGRDGSLIKVSSLNTDPEKQTEDYTVVAQADHGEWVSGEAMPVPTIEKQFGSCRVWIEEDGLHARMYFAEDDPLADHAWALANDASYSVGYWWFEDGYDGADNHIDGYLEILREISMVTTGNDPRTKTLNHLGAKAKGEPVSTGATDENINQKEDTMNKVVNTLSDEDKAEVAEIVKTAIAEATAETEEASEAEAPAEEVEAPETDDKAPATDGEGAGVAESSLHMPIVVVKNNSAKQESGSVKQDWLHSNDGRKAFNDAIKQAGGRFNSVFASAWLAEASKHVKINDITGLPTPVPVEELYFSTLEKSDGILSHVRMTGLKSYRVTSLSADQDDESGRAHGHTKGNTKTDQDVTALSRSVFPRMIYKRQSIDSTDLYNNPYLMDFTAQELVDAIILEQERGIVIGDGRSSGTPDYRIFDGTNGIQNIKTDTGASSGTIGAYLAGTVTAQSTDNLRDAVNRARYEIKTPGNLIVVAKAEAITDLLLAKDNDGRYLFQGTPESILGVTRVYTPSWMDNETNLAYVFVEGSYYMVGENGINAHPDFDTTYNTNILLDETMRGGSLAQHKCAMAIAPYSEG